MWLRRASQQAPGEHVNLESSRGSQAPTAWRVDSNRAKDLQITQFPCNSQPAKRCLRRVQGLNPACLHLKAPPRLKLLNTKEPTRWSSAEAVLLT